MSGWLIICMGVSGSGKTTYARALASEYDMPFLEADDLHSPGNKEKMRSGQPLTDTDRAPWMAQVCKKVRQHRRSQKGCVLAHSALKRKHRDQLRNAGLKTLFLHFFAPKEVIAQRMNERTGHFMPAALLDSQFATLEQPSGEPDVLEIDASEDKHKLIARTLNLANEYTNRGTLNAPTTVD